MTKRTKKVGVTGKYGTRYGASLRKQVKKMEVCFFWGGFSLHFSLTHQNRFRQNVKGKIKNWLMYVFTVP